MVIAILCVAIVYAASIAFVEMCKPPTPPDLSWLETIVAHLVVWAISPILAVMNLINGF